MGAGENIYEIRFSAKFRFVFLIRIGKKKEVGNLVFYVLKMLKKLPYCFVIRILYLHTQLLLFTSALQ